jgi:hypothetical protein
MSTQPLSIDDFYDADERRRESMEYEFGSQWTDESGNEYELSWVATTGELYLMASPEALPLTSPFGDYWVGSEPVDELSVIVISQVATHDELESRLDGWETAIEQPNSLRWLTERFPAAQ